MGVIRYVIASFAIMASHISYGADLYELRVGLVWHYEIEGAEQKAARSSISRSVVVNDIEWFELIEYGERFWVRNSQQGQVEAVNFYDRELNTSEPIEEVLVFKYPVTVGENWGDTNSKSSYLGRRDVQVQAGTFSCHVYRFDLGAGAYSESCVAEGVGVVFNEFKGSGESIEVSKLVRYER